MINPEGGKISGSQFVFLIVGFTMGSSLLLIPGREAGHDAWIAILIGIIEALAFLFLIFKLATRFPGKTLVEINDMVYGAYIGKFISALFLWFLFHVSSLIIKIFSDFFTTHIMPETPALVFMVLMVMICAMAVRNGIEVLARCSQVLVPSMVLIVFGTTLLLLKDMDIRNFQPVLEAPLSELLWAAHGTASFPLIQNTAFLMVVPFLNKKQEAFPSVAKGIAIAGFILTVASMRNIAVLGATSAITIYPSYEAARLIDIAEIITRLEVVIGINLMTMGFLKISVLYYGAVLGTAQILALRTYLPLVLPFGVLIIVLSVINATNITQMLEFVKVLGIYYPPFEIGIPLLTLLIAVLRGLPKEGA